MTNINTWDIRLRHQLYVKVRYFLTLALGQARPWVRQGPEQGKVLGKARSWARQGPGQGKVLGKARSWARQGPGQGKALGKARPWVRPGPGQAKALGPSKEPMTIFTTLHFLLNLRMGPIS
jgi:hypothetical protein